MNVVEINGVSKIFGNSKVIDNISFTVHANEILGLVGPNGAGKTTIIRMLMDIIRPDSGEFFIFGQTLNESTKDKIGYLPEERGLYKKLRVGECLSYLAAIKNTPKNIAEENIDKLIKLVAMYKHRDKKIEELSKGMGQLIQFIAAIVHNPDLVVLDEPFAGLDPVNTKLIKDIIVNLKEEGKSIILSTHLMSQVEELCDRVVMIDKGRVVLYGNLTDIKARYGNKSLNDIFIQVAEKNK